MLHVAVFFSIQKQDNLVHFSSWWLHSTARSCSFMDQLWWITSLGKSPSSPSPHLGHASSCRDVHKNEPLFGPPGPSCVSLREKEEGGQIITRLARVFCTDMQIVVIDSSDGEEDDIPACKNSLIYSIQRRGLLKKNECIFSADWIPKRFLELPCLCQCINLRVCSNLDEK